MLTTAQYDTVISKATPIRDYLYFEKEEKSSHNRRCIDGHITGCGKCVGYCQYAGHSGFLTQELRREHDCLGKGCFYYLPKIKQKHPQKVSDTSPEQVVTVASKLLAQYEGLRILKAEKASKGGWLLKYVTITNDYSISSIELQLSTEIGEPAVMVNLNYDFEKAAKLIFRYEYGGNYGNY